MASRRIPASMVFLLSNRSDSWMRGLSCLASEAGQRSRPLRRHQGTLSHHFAPVEKLLGIDPVFAGHCRQGIPLQLALLQNGAFSFRRTPTAALDGRDHLDGTHADPILRGSHTTRRTLIIYIHQEKCPVERGVTSQTHSGTS